jgi:branched-chain amino acid transport system permease protein
MIDTAVIVSGLINGTIYGLLLFMLASGLTLVFSMMGVLNFAHASMFMLGSYFCYQLTAAFGLTVFGFLASVLFSTLAVGLIGAAVERYGLRYLHQHGHVPQLLLTFGLTLVIQEVVVMIWGRYPVQHRLPAALSEPAFTFLGATYPTYKLLVIAVAIALFITLWLVIQFTRLGLVVRASLTNSRAARMLGHNVELIFLIVFSLGSAMAGLAGCIGGFAFVTEPNMASTVGPIIFVVIVIGGLGSLVGGLISALLIGILQSLVASLDISLAGILKWAGAPLNASAALAIDVPLSRFGPLIPYFLLIAMLAIRPRGLLGTRE